MERRKQTKREWYRKENEKNERKSDGWQCEDPRAISSPSQCPSVLLGGGGSQPKMCLVRPLTSDAMVSFMEMVRPNCEAERAGA